jgi:septum site-determining protein MinD
MGKIIGVLSLKGGVGKTSSVVSLGYALSSFGKKVLLVDGNFSTPNLGIHLNIINPDKTIHHVLADKYDIQSAIYSSENLEIIPASVFPKVIIDPLKLKDKLAVLKDVYDFILIDSSPALNNETLGAMLAADEIFVVSTPDLSTLSMTLKAIKIANKKDAKISGIILNKVYNKSFEISLDKIEETSEIPVLAVIPHDVNVLKSQSNFIPSTQFKPRSDSSVEYMKLAACILGERYYPVRFKDRFYNRVTPSKQEINRELFYKSVFLS